jgi:peptide deformylase
MKILKYPDPFLFKVCKQVKPEEFDENLEKLLEQMWEVLETEKAVGLSANQVGLDLKMFVMKGPKDEKLFFINPEITKKSLNPISLEEGCLSAPGQILTITDRASWVELVYQDLLGQTKRAVFHNLHSVCVQHEMEHLNGKTFLQSNTIPRKFKMALAKSWKL